MPDGCKQLGSFKLIRVQSPFDFVLCNRRTNHFVFCDAKTVQTNTFVPSMIKEHQVNELEKFDGLNSSKAGYLISFDKLSKAAFFDTEALRTCVRTGKGLRPENGIALGHKFNLCLNDIFTNA